VKTSQRWSKSVKVHVNDDDRPVKLVDFEEVANNWKDYEKIIYREPKNLPQYQSKKFLIFALF
jgi:hypothetical protein